MQMMLVQPTYYFDHHRWRSGARRLAV